MNQKLCNTDSLHITGVITGIDVVKEVLEPSYIEIHEKVVPHTSTFQSTLL